MGDTSWNFGVLGDMGLWDQHSCMAHLAPAGTRPSFPGPTFPHDPCTHTRTGTMSMVLACPCIKICVWLCAAIGLGVCLCVCGSHLVNIYWALTTCQARSTVWEPDHPKPSEGVGTAGPWAESSLLVKTPSGCLSPGHTCLYCAVHWLSLSLDEI